MFAKKINKFLEIPVETSVYKFIEVYGEVNLNWGKRKYGFNY